ncbi:helix-turn-helix domain-containing protein [Mycolicibacter kumamotonensis]|uniref:helix-turn-helix domain-containing protein n=1 Tax=Mycolicibacter kumamotonensis TaxID=354243 RepID=UPI0010564E11|nr:helix-turn-helix domain-containing protein [Mycolicibacter kumamotonensis]
MRYFPTEAEHEALVEMRRLTRRAAAYTEKRRAITRERGELIRAHAGIPPTRVAEACGFSPAQVSKIRRGEKD